MKKLLSMMCAAAAMTAMSAVYQDGPIRSEKWTDLKIEMAYDGNCWRISQDTPLFAARFADIYHPADMLNIAETRELAKTVAVAIANHLGTTNAVRVVRREVPAPAGTNLVDRLQAEFAAKYITEEVVPLN